MFSHGFRVAGSALGTAFGYQSRLFAQRDFGTDYDAAMVAYSEIEGEMRERDDLDIVLVGADSLETVKRTHSSSDRVRLRKRSGAYYSEPMDVVRVIYHHEDDGWWAESPDVERWYAAGATYAEVHQLAEEGIPFALGHEAELQQPATSA